MEYPLHGMLHEVGMQDPRNDGICIVLEPPPLAAQDPYEARSDESVKSGKFRGDAQQYFFFRNEQMASQETVIDVVAKTLSAQLGPVHDIAALNQPAPVRLPR